MLSGDMAYNESAFEPNRSLQVVWNMDITFERGSEAAPKGHAFVYFRSSLDAGEVWASYLVILPITVDITKYVPPFLMGQLPDASMQDLSSFAFPPAPERMESLDQILELADARDDDILFAGAFNTSDLPSMMMAAGDAVQQYTELYNSVSGRARAVDASTAEDTLDPGSVGVNEVMYGLMSDSDKLAELTTLVGKLRFAVDSNEDALIREAETDIASLSRHLDFEHKTDRIVEGIKQGSEDARRLTMLYVQRCYCIVQEDYLTLGNVEDQIAAIETGNNAPGQDT